MDDGRDSLTADGIGDRPSGVASFIREENGKLSSSRLLLMIWGGGVFLIWAISSLKSATLQTIPDSVITVVGLCLGAKTVQRFGES
jgi:hypothetical protein